MSSFTSAEQANRMAEAASFEQAKRAVVAYVYAKHPEVIQCEGSQRMILELLIRWAGSDVYPTPALWESMLDENPDALKSLATQPLEKTKTQLIEDILLLLKSRNQGRDGKFDDWALRNEESRMKSWSIEALRTRLNEIRVKQRMSAQPVAVLKAVVADAHRDQGVDGYPRLPATMWSSEQGKFIQVDANYLNGLARTDIWQFKKLVKIYGSAQIDRTRGVK
jgi:hypothetical protein